MDSDNRIQAPQVAAIMTEKLETINVTDSASQAALQMKQKNVSSLAVLYDDGRPAGILTERDFVRRLCTTNKSITDVKVIELLSAPVKTVKSDSSIGEAADKMVNNKVRHLLVVDQKNKAIGIVSATDIVSYVKGTATSDMELADNDVIAELEREGRFYF